MKKRVMLILSCLFLSIGFISAQTRTITGTVVDETGEPVIGASVVVKGTTVGVATGIDGTFSVDVPAGKETLVFSLIGMKALERRAVSNMKVIMSEDARLLEDVFVVAYGTATKSSFTGSASVVKADDIGKIQATNPISALTGRASGVQIFTASGQPGVSATSIRIRGISSVNAENTPLVILDGVPYDGDLNTINNQDIESMTVLKDAASSALYGARGANGVIIITNKKGKVGAAKIVVDTKWGANSRATQNYKLVTNPAQHYEMYYSALKNYGQNNLNQSAGKAHTWANDNLIEGDYGLIYNAYNVPTGQNMIGSNGKLNPNATLGNKVSLTDGREYYLTPDDWMDAAYKTSLRQEYNVSISAGTDVSSFYASFNYLDNGGITKNSDYNRLIGNLRADYQAKPWLKVGGNMSYTNYKYNQLGNDGSTNSSGNLFAIANQIAPIYPLYVRDANGNIMTDIYGNTVYDYGDLDTEELSRPIFTGTNALSDARLNTNEGNGNTVNATGFAEIRFLKDFKFMSTNTAYVDEYRTTNVSNPYYGSSASSSGYVSKSHYRTRSHNVQQLLSYTKTFGMHNIDAQLVHEAYTLKSYYLNASRTNMFDPGNTELAGAVIDNSMNSYTGEYNTEGYIFRGLYNYDSKYFGSFSYRRDASSRFHKDNRWGNFWSLSGAWNMTNEKSLQLPTWVDLLKFKASYGEVGNDRIGSNRFTNIYDVVVSPGGNAGVISGSVQGNKNITWETIGNFNTGFDIGLFKNRLNATIEYYYRKTSDMLAYFTLPASYGYGGYYTNIGDMTNQGFEIELSGTPIEIKDFTWDMRLNITFNKNKLAYLPEARKTTITSEGVKGYSSGNYFYGEGQSLYTFYFPKYAGINEKGESLYYRDVPPKTAGEEKTRGTTTKYSDATQYLCGTALPDAYGGFGTSLSYKDFDMSIDFAYQLGGKVYDTDYHSYMSSPKGSSKGGAFHADLLNSWSPENPKSRIPRLQYADETNRSSRFLTSASYLSLQNINAGYTLPSNLCNHMGINKLRFYVACDNIFMWSKRQGMDPRQSVSGSITSTYYAPIRTISGGLTLTF